MLKRLFTHHPASVGESYLEHLFMACSFGLRMTATGLACLCHALLPFTFVKTGSRMITQLHNEMVTNRDRRTAPKMVAAE